MMVLHSSATTAVVTALLITRPVLAQTYQATWSSTDQHKPAPEWFQDAKFGVYWHWGAFTTPEYAYEWYGREMYEQSGVRTEHTRRYGSPESWGYDNFITGRNDLQGRRVQFHPVLSSAGGQFNPVAWIDLVVASGARFAGPVSEHHDGFSMWNSTVNEWNSVSQGPNIDLLKVFTDEIRKRGLKVLVAMHHAFNTNGFFRLAPRQTSTSFQKLYGQLPKEASDQLWFDKQREVIDQAKPDIIWNDFALNSPGYCHDGSPSCSIAENQRLKFLAYYFNKGVEWGKEVVTTHKHFDPGFRDTSTVADYERGGPADIVNPYWLTDDSVSSSSWSYTVGMGYYSSTQMIHSLLDRISKNGNMLLNISPTAAGLIPSQQQTILRDIGAYLARYGESVYNTRAWTTYGEGPTKAGGGSFTAPMLGTNRDLRFTRSKSGTVLYITVLGWTSQVIVTSLGSSSKVGNLSGGKLQSVQLLGNSAGSYIAVPSWSQNSNNLVIDMPSQPAASVAYVLKLSFNTPIAPVIPSTAPLSTPN